MSRVAKCSKSYSSEGEKTIKIKKMAYGIDSPKLEFSRHQTNQKFYSIHWNWFWEMSDARHTTHDKLSYQRKIEFKTSQERKWRQNGIGISKTTHYFKL